MIDRSEAGRWIVWLSLGASIAAHALAAGILFGRETAKFGSATNPTMAISINLETTDIIDAAEQSAAEAAAAAPATAETPPAKDAKVQDPEPQPVEDPPPEVQSTQEHAKPEPLSALTPPDEKQETPVDRHDRDRLDEDALHQKRVAEVDPQQADPPARELPRKPAVEEEPKPPKKAAKRKTASASAGAIGSDGAQSSRGRISASQGTLRNYGASVRAKIARNKPSVNGVSGEVVITFAVSSSGQLISAAVLSSSGNASLDRGALSAVRRAAPFPVAPPGATPSQLRFTMPFHFR